MSSLVNGKNLSVGGNITINSINVVALNGSQINAQATNQGQGGNIIVNAVVFLHDASTANVLNASSRIEGNEGTVTLNAPVTDISGSLVALNPAYLNASSQFSPRCGSQAMSERSRFTVQGRGALPPSPDQPLPVTVSRCDPGITGSASPTLYPPETAVIANPGFGDR